MKGLLICALFLLPHFLHGQFIDTLYRDWNSVAGFFKTDSGSLIVTGDAYLLFLDNDGKLIRTEYIEPVNSDLNAADNVFSAYGSQADSFFYVTTFDNHCDYVDNFRLNKIDWEGNVISYHSLEGWYFSKGRIVFPNKPGLPMFIDVLDENILLQYANDSTLVLPYSSYVRETAISEEGNIAILTRDSLFYYEWNSGGLSLKKSVKYNQQPEWETKLDFIGNQILVTGDDELILLNAELLAERKVTYPGEIVYAIESSPNQIGVITGAYNNKSVFHVYDLTLTLQAEYNLGFNSLYTKAFDFSDTLLTVAGIEFFPEDKWAVAIHQTDLTNLLGAVKTDIALSNVRFIYSNSSDRDCYAEPVRNHYLYGITIELTNEGNRIINDVVITAERTYCHGFCWYEDINFYRTFSDINLLPQENREFFIESALVQAYRNDDEFKCLMAVFPDMRVDVDHADNSFCLDVTTAVEDRYEVDASVFPNPVEDMLFITAGHEIKKIGIINMNGVKLLEQNHREEGVNVSKLLPGIYFISIELMNGNLINSKFIKN